MSDKFTDDGMHEIEDDGYGWPCPWCGKELLVVGTARTYKQAVVEHTPVCSERRVDE